MYSVCFAGGGNNLRLAVLYGGTSSERDVSLVSGRTITQALADAGHNVTPLEWSEREVVERADELNGFDLIFLGYHGGMGEDGRVQATLELLGIPFTGSGSAASVLGMNKAFSKLLFREHNIPTADWVVVSHDTSLDEIIRRAEAGVGYPIAVKPASEGSTIGFSRVDSPDNLPYAVENARKYDKYVIVERFIEGRELTVGIIGDKPLPLVEIVPKHGIYDYECKYTHGMSAYLCPAPVDDETVQKAQKYALDAYRVLGCRNYARVDFRMDNRGRLYCLEVNTLPGMTNLSLVPMAAAEAGLSFTDLLDTIAEDAVTYFEAKE